MDFSVHVSNFILQSTIKNIIMNEMNLKRKNFGRDTRK